MIKGVQKRIIVVKTADSPIFEEVCFIMRRDAKTRGGDMVTEANRIIGGYGVSRLKCKRRKIGQWLYIAGSFVGGGAVGGIAVGLIGLLV